MDGELLVVINVMILLVGLLQIQIIKIIPIKNFLFLITVV